MSRNSSHSIKKSSYWINHSGMSLPELIVSVGLLAAFTALYVAFNQLINSQYTPYKSAKSGTQGFLVDQHDLLMAMDSWAEILSQPGYTKEDIQDIIALGCTTPPPPPRTIWNIPGKQEINLPEGYDICLLQTSLSESNISHFLSSEKGKDSKPGIYILYALPSKITKEALPVRRIFCRPKLYC